MRGNFNPIDTLRSRPGLFIGAVLTVVIVLGLMSALRHPSSNSSSQLYPNAVPQESVSLVHETTHGTRFAAPTATATVRTNHALKPYTVHVDLPPDTNPPVLSFYAPIGRLLQCQLVNTVDSGADHVPVIALVTEDLWHQGKLVIPVGAEVHGMAQSETLRDRILAEGLWTIVQQSGEELRVNGRALDRQWDAQTGKWGLTDGSPGLAGEVIRSQSLDEIRLFAATAMSGVASSLQRYQTTAMGVQISDTARNAPLAGASEVLNSYAQQILDTIKKQGVFVRVPAGKQFYLYITETIDMSQAKIGSQRVTDHSAENAVHSTITHHEK